ncbi:unnamed protein product [Pleuronectes platessa]|uniref:Uncharacterized protein n=1 Tax=Pleuronectes platessa TaxID=8262 RepID=A0A9N7U3G7_PLEPL|nr:unnamed protein product [Pleuronectes platessa]
MIKSIRRNEQPLRDVLTTTTKIVMPTTAEMDKLQRLETLLEPYRYLTELLGGEKYVSCSVALPAFCHLSRVMESSDDDPAHVTRFKSTFRNDVETPKGKANIAYLKIATAFDPRFKYLKCIPRAERSEVRDSVTKPDEPHLCPVWLYQDDSSSSGEIPSRLQTAVFHLVQSGVKGSLGSDFSAFLSDGFVSLVGSDITVP